MQWVVYLRPLGVQHIGVTLISRCTRSSIRSQLGLALTLTLFVIVTRLGVRPCIPCIRLVPLALHLSRRRLESSMTCRLLIGPLIAMAQKAATKSPPTRRPHSRTLFRIRVASSNRSSSCVRKRSTPPTTAYL